MPKSRLRIVSYNIQVLTNGADGVIDTLARLAPDLIGLQEVDRGTTRSQGTSQAQVLAEALGMQFAYAAAMPYQGGEFGIAILCRGTLDDVHIERLPRGGNEEPRVAMLATCRLADGRTVRFGNTHLASDWHTHNPEKVRATQTAALMQLLRAEADAGQLPVFLVGDFNCDSGSAALAQVRAAARPLHEEFKTYPSTAPAEALDHAFYIASTLLEKYLVDVVGAQADTSTASDHLPLVVDLVLSESEAAAE